MQHTLSSHMCGCNKAACSTQHQSRAHKQAQHLWVLRQVADKRTCAAAAVVAAAASPLEKGRPRAGSSKPGAAAAGWAGSAANRSQQIQDRVK
eukprot:1157822-Pelagomonas_calceolata.AAC.20